MNEKTEFTNRLIAAMQEAGFEARASVLEKEFNTRYWGTPITYQAVSRWLKGEAIPSQDKLQVLADWLKIEPQVLRFGELAIASVKRRKKRWEDAINGQEREVLEAFIALPAAQKKIAREVIFALGKTV